MDSDQDPGIKLFPCSQLFKASVSQTVLRAFQWRALHLIGCQAARLYHQGNHRSGPRALGVPSKVPNAGTSHRERLVKERFIRLSDDSMAQDWSSEMFESNRRRFLVDAKCVVVVEMSLSELLDLNVLLLMEEKPGSDLALRKIIGSLMIMCPSSTSSSCRSHSSCSSLALIPGDNDPSMKNSRGSSESKQLCRFGVLIALPT